MARVSTKETKNIYHKTRESLQLSREAASELLESISPERIEKIENERSLPHPDEVLVMAEKYKQPSLCNYYCANQCPIGQEYVPEVKIKDLSQIVLEMLASLNSMNKQKERLIEITVDGHISGDEIQDFIHIQEELERISIAVETLQLWSERMLATGVIDEAQRAQEQTGLILHCSGNSTLYFADTVIYFSTYQMYNVCITGYGVPNRSERSGTFEHKRKNPDDPADRKSCETSQLRQSTWN